MADWTGRPYIRGVTAVWEYPASITSRHSAGMSGARGGAGGAGGGSLKSDAMSLYVSRTGPKFPTGSALMRETIASDSCNNVRTQTPSVGCELEFFEYNLVAVRLKLLWTVRCLAED